MKNKSEILLRGNDVVCPLKIPSFFSQKVENYKKIRYNKSQNKMPEIEKSLEFCRISYTNKGDFLWIRYYMT